MADAPAAGALLRGQDSLPPAPRNLAKPPRKSTNYVVDKQGNSGQPKRGLRPPRRHSGARAQRGSPESIATVGDHGFRARGFAAPRNDPGGTTAVAVPNQRCTAINAVTRGFHALLRCTASGTWVRRPTASRENGGWARWTLATRSAFTD